MKLKNTFELMELDGSNIAVPVGEGAESFKGIIKMNETAKDIFEFLKEETTLDQVVEKMCEIYSGDKDSIRKATEETINTFVNAGFIEL